MGGEGIDIWLEDIFRMTGRWSEPQSGPWEIWWWKGKVCRLERMRSGLPVPLCVKQVGKSGPRKPGYILACWCG